MPLSYTLFQIITTLIWLYSCALIASVILSWLVAFNIVNPRQPWVWRIGRFLWRITEPALRRIRKVVPPFAGMDFSPVILLVGLQVLEWAFEIVWRILFWS